MSIDIIIKLCSLNVATDEKSSLIFFKQKSFTVNWWCGDLLWLILNLSRRETQRCAAADDANNTKSDALEYHTEYELA